MKRLLGNQKSRRSFVIVIFILSLISIISVLSRPFNFSPVTSAQKITPQVGQSFNVLKQNDVLSAQASSSISSQTPTSTQAPSPTTKPVPRGPQFSGNQVRVPILMYHYIGNNPNPKDTQRDVLSVSPDKFQEQMQYLADNNYTPITFDTLYPILKKQASLPNKPVILTFDDGYQDFYTIAYPILLRFHLKATVFIPTGLMDQGYYLTWNEIKQMQNSGLISFQAHSIHHYNLPSLSNASQQSEISESKKSLEGQIGVPVNFFAYPYGAYNNITIQNVKKAGFLGAISTWGSKTQSEGTMFEMPRLRVSGKMDLKTFTSLL